MMAMSSSSSLRFRVLRVSSSFVLIFMGGSTARRLPHSLPTSPLFPPAVFEEHRRRRVEDAEAFQPLFEEAGEGFLAGRRHLLQPFHEPRLWRDRRPLREHPSSGRETHFECTPV